MHAKEWGKYMRPVDAGNIHGRLQGVHRAVDLGCLLSQICCCHPSSLSPSNPLPLQATMICLRGKQVSHLLTMFCASSSCDVPVNKIRRPALPGVITMKCTVRVFRGVCSTEVSDPRQYQAAFWGCIAPITTGAIEAFSCPR